MTDKNNFYYENNKDDSDNQNAQNETYGLQDESYGEDDILSEEEIVKENIEKRKAERIKKSKGPSFLMKFVICVIVFGGLLAFSLSSFFTVDGIDVQGNSYFSDDEIINMAHASPGSNLIYKAGKGSIKKYLKQNAYIADVSVHRKLPSTLVIKVKEREQVGAIVYGDEYLIIDADGILLRKTKTEPKITILRGIKVKSIELGKPLDVQNKDVFDNALKIIKAMQSGDMYFVEIDMSELYVNAKVYKTLVCKGTAKQLIQAINKDRLQKIIKELFNRNIKRGTITISSDGYASFSPNV